MIRVKKNYEQVPEGLTMTGAEERRAAALQEGNHHNFSGYYYAHDSVKAQLTGIYRDKCAFCESRTGAGAPLQVEHYRPKKNLTDDEAHPGYYWLGYEWSNLLLSCATCNRAKSNRFPIEGSRVEAPQDERSDWLADSESFTAEKPLLLNPELDSPDEHLVFSPDGEIEAKADSKRGQTTIEVCKLNRPNLRVERKNLINRFRDDIRNQVDIILDLRDEGELQTLDRMLHALELAFRTLFENLMNTQNPQQQYSRLGWHLANDFQTFIINNLPAGEPREIVGFAFELFRAEWGHDVVSPNH
jgi:uncharacterized protein (TIGR02646 family)